MKSASPYPEGQKTAQELMQCLRRMLEASEDDPTAAAASAADVCETMGRHVVHQQSLRLAGKGDEESESEYDPTGIIEEVLEQLIIFVLELVSHVEYLSHEHNRLALLLSMVKAEGAKSFHIKASFGISTNLIGLMQSGRGFRAVLGRHDRYAGMGCLAF